MNSIVSIVLENENNPNLKAFLKTLRFGEGTFDDGGYNRIFGGSKFSSYADHPRIMIRANGISSNAAGAYQFLSTTWDDLRNRYGADSLPDFSPKSQDRAAMFLLADNGALRNAINGDFEIAVNKVAHIWASLPGAGYNQPEVAMAKIKELYLKLKGEFSKGVEEVEQVASAVVDEVKKKSLS